MGFGIILLFACKTLEKIFAPKQNTPEPASKAPQVSEDQMARERQKFEAEMSAFQELMNYNQNIAYGINKRKED